jgi:hypothetical protein
VASTSILVWPVKQYRHRVAIRTLRSHEYRTQKHTETLTIIGGIPATLRDRPVKRDDHYRHCFYYMEFEFPLATTLVEDLDLVYMLVEVIKVVAVAMLRIPRTALRQLDGINGRSA